MTLEQVRMWLASETVTPEQADRYIFVITQIERERIIKLLEQETDIIYEFAYAIELIKREPQP